MLLLEEPTREQCRTCLRDVEACDCPIQRRTIAELICGDERHARIKGDPVLFRTSTTHKGWQRDEEGRVRWEWRNCNACGSTLGRELDDDERAQHAPAAHVLDLLDRAAVVFPRGFFNIDPDPFRRRRP